MDKRTVTAQEVRDTFLVENIEQAVADIAQTMGGTAGLQDQRGDFSKLLYFSTRGTETGL